MYVGVTGRHMVVTPALKDYAEQKVSKPFPNQALW